MQNKEIKLATKEKFNGAQSDKIKMATPKVFHLRKFGNKLDSPEGTFLLIEALCSLSSEELNEFTSTNYFILVKELSSFLGEDVLSGIVKPEK